MRVAGKVLAVTVAGQKWGRAPIEQTMGETGEVPCPPKPARPWQGPRRAPLFHAVLSPLRCACCAPHLEQLQLAGDLLVGAAPHHPRRLAP